MLVLKQVFTFLKRAVPLASFFKSVCISDWPVTSLALAMEQRTLKIVINCLNKNIYSYLETSGGQSCNLYLNAVHFFNTSVN